MNEASPAIELIDADIRRVRSSAPAPILREVRWTVKAGEFWALGGAPGAGKTDLLCTAAALQRPLNGYHLLFGRDTRLMDEQELVLTHRKAAMIFDNGRLFPRLTVEENLSLPLAYHSELSRHEIPDRVGRVLQATGLEKVRDREPRQITRNLHQRVALARALTLEPEVLLIDSPLGAVDPRVRRWWIEFLCALHKGHPLLNHRPVTIVVTADDLLPWSDVANRFAVIREHALRVVGGREELQQTREASVREFLTPAFEDEL